MLDANVLLMVLVGDDGRRVELHAVQVELAVRVFESFGIPRGRVILEDRSRNTLENALFTRDMLQPQPGQQFVLVTSAWHMPRAMQTFAAAGWTGLTAWPVDYRSLPRTFRAGWRLDEHLVEADLALKEYLGQFAYWLAGKA